MRFFTLFSYLITKESYNWWITRREWGFRHQISEAKYQKISVANIWKHSGEFHRRARWIRNFATWRTQFRSQRLISQPSSCDFATKGWFHSLRNWPSAWCDWLPMALTPWFQLRIKHRLKRWITDFPSFETTYSIHKLSSRKCSKSAWKLLFSWMLPVRFLSLFSLFAFMICLWKRIIKLQSFGSSCYWASHCFAMDSKELSSILDCFGDQITNKNTKTYTIWL